MFDFEGALQFIDKRIKDIQADLEQKAKARSNVLTRLHTDLKKFLTNHNINIVVDKYDDYIALPLDDKTGIHITVSDAGKFAISAVGNIGYAGEDKISQSDLDAVQLTHALVSRIVFSRQTP